MVMTDDEIIVMYGLSKDKKEKIKILAELNYCSVEEIEEIVLPKKEKSNTEQEINNLTKENKELKAMLKNALTIINSVCYCGGSNCNYCAYECACHDSEDFKWVHEDKIKKLVGGDE